jgi:hypothetical protein
MVIQEPHFSFIRIWHSIRALHEMKDIFLLVAVLRNRSSYGYYFTQFDSI